MGSLAFKLRRGWKRPVGIPRLNREHPLAQGLVFYGVDLGNGTILDLVGNRQANRVPGATRAGLAMFPTIGQMIEWNGSDGIYFASDAAIRSAQQNKILSFACGMVSTTSTGTVANARPFCRTAQNNASAPWLNLSFITANAGASIQALVNIGGGNYASIGSSYTLTPNKPVVMVAQADGTLNGISRLYINGANVFTSTPSFINVGDDDTGDPIVFSGSSGVGVSGPWNGFVPFGAIWARPVSQQEAQHIYLEPWDMLIFPEEEIFTSGKGHKLYSFGLSSSSKASPSVMMQTDKQQNAPVDASPTLNFSPTVPPLTVTANASASLAEQKYSSTIVISATVNAAASMAIIVGHIIAATSGLFMSLVTGLIGKALVASAAVATSVSWLPAKILTATASTSTSIARLAQRTMLPAQACAAAALSYLKAQTIAASAKTGGALVRSVSAVRTAAVGSAAQFARIVSRAPAAVGNTTATLLIEAAIVHAAAAQAVGIMARVQAKIVRAGASASASRILPAVLRAFSSTSSSAGAISRMPNLGRSAEAQAEAQLDKMQQKLVGSADVTASAALGRLVEKVPTAQSKMQQILLRTAQTYDRALNASAATDSTLSRRISRVISALVGALSSVTSSVSFDSNRQISVVNESFGYPTLINEIFAGMTTQTIIGPQGRTSFIGNGYSPVPAVTTPTYAAQLVDENGNPIGSTGIDTLTLSIVDTITGSVINNASQVNILNAGRGTIDSQGNLLITLEVGDTDLFNPDDDVEERSLIIDWTYNGGARAGRHQVDFQIQALSGL
jgi:hypothetical protein